MTHPSRTAKQGNRYTDTVTKGINADQGPFKEAREVFCKQCGMACNLDRDARRVDEYAGEDLEHGILITDHAYSVPYTGESRTTSDLSTEISNGSFEDWTAGVLDDWTTTGTTVTEETGEGYYDLDGYSSSAKIVRSGSDVTLSQDALTPSNFNDNILFFKARVKCLTKDVIRLRVALSSTDYYSDYNRGQTRFEDLVLTIKCPSTVSTLTVYIAGDNQDGTAYVDNAVLGRNGNTTTAKVRSGCPHCGSYDYY